MEPPQKRSKNENKGKLEVLIRMCDPFTRTVNGKIIRPTIKAEESFRVFFKLQRDVIINMVTTGGKQFGLEYGDIQWHPSDSQKTNEGNIFIKYTASQPLNYEKFDQYKKHIKSEMIKKDSKVKDILIHQVQDLKTIPQPIISETDFEIYKLDLTIKRLSNAENTLPDRTALAIAAENIKSQLEDVKEQYTKIAVLSQNGFKDSAGELEQTSIKLQPVALAYISDGSDVVEFAYASK
ncbi:uncharacterized protein LOC115459039 [Microcaecilia unicolor]|uniref:Uncharacterized protein LOC115459039 n=1 Tax=Microcaecilia unicolor TaxID=1415580 RepID=A0A6P7WNH8_9AMPH|nr:uncharacterized protein LOC115459039 [Microcaecilia unicolor]